MDYSEAWTSVKVVRIQKCFACCDIGDTVPTDAEDEVQALDAPDTKNSARHPLMASLCDNERKKNSNDRW